MSPATEKSYTPTLKKIYYSTIVPQLIKEFGYKNAMEAPRLQKIVINMGLSAAREDIKVVDAAVDEISRISGQKPQVCRAKKSISNFKLRQGMPIGVKVTLRGDRMYEFFERLITVSMPRIRDFRGVEPNGFDGNGNFNLGLKDQHIFTEIDLEKSDKARGMNITIVTSASKDEGALHLLGSFGFPFKKRKTN